MEMAIKIGVYLLMLHFLVVREDQTYGYVDERVCKHTMHSFHEHRIRILNILLCLVKIGQLVVLETLKLLIVDNGFFQSFTILLHGNFIIIRLTGYTSPTPRDAHEQPLFRWNRSPIWCKKPALDLDIIHG